jgi:UDP-N-acetylmuramate--alanine ligase
MNMREPRPAGLHHIIGIGGIGMSAIAEIMLARGYEVQGSDLKDGPNLQRLAARGIQVFVGHSGENLKGVSQIVISTAVKPGNPELDAAMRLGLPVMDRAAMLARLMHGFRTISVTGSHGKTTTTSMVAWLLEQGRLDPTALIGGIIGEWGSNARVGASEWMVVEADESDATFIKLPTEIGVATNIDPEHLDFYGSVEALHDAFRAFFRGVPRHGALVAGADHPVVAALLQELRGERAAPRIVTFGESEDADIRVRISPGAGGRTKLDVRIRWLGEAERSLAGIMLRVPGRYNALNAAGAIAVALQAGLSDSAIRKGLETFGGVDRRFTQTGAWNGVSIYDDYAHHPAEIEAVLSAARGAAKGRVIAIMQPHRFSRLKALFDGFCTCFADADMVLIAPVYPAGETPNGVDSASLVEGIRRSGHQRVYSVSGEETLAPAIASLARPGDVVISLGAGNITEWARALPGRLSAFAPALGAAE